MIDRVFLGVSITFFFLGIMLPMFTLQKFFIVKDTFSLVGGVEQLFIAKEYLLVLVIAGFSIITPIIKFILSWLVLSVDEIDQQKRLLAIRKLAMICKWSMADVFIIAILAATIKLGGLATVKVHIGLWFFAAYVVLSMILTHRLLARYQLLPVESDTQSQVADKA